MKDLAGSYKKTHYLKEALSHSWAASNYDYRCEGGETGNSILHVAATLGENKLVSAIAHVSDDEVNAVNNVGDSALHLAAEYNRPQVIESLLKHGASLEKRNSFEFTALQIASIKCHRPC